MGELNRTLDGESVSDVISGMDLEEMANMLGMNVNVEKIDFSFYFSMCDGNPYGIRAKIQWLPNRFRGNGDGFMVLHGDYEYHSESNLHVPQKDITKARNFFKKYKVFFAAVWEDVLDPFYVQDYLRQLITFDEMLTYLEVDQALLKDVHDLKTLEKVVRKNNLFNMND